jgi:GNAT superfamily N-acetyltransferase
VTAEIRAIGWSRALFAALAAEGAAGDGRFLSRLEEEWRCGTLRFRAPGEVLLGTLDDDRLIGVGGISLDPYAPVDRLARLRHLYVARARRREGVGTALALALVERARGHFDRIRLTTDAAARFYERLGFVAEPGEKQTHVLRLEASSAVQGGGSTREG